MHPMMWMRTRQANFATAKSEERILAFEESPSWRWMRAIFLRCAPIWERAMKREEASNSAQLAAVGRTLSEWCATMMWIFVFDARKGGSRVSDCRQTQEQVHSRRKVSRRLASQMVPPKCPREWRTALVGMMSTP